MIPGLLAAFICMTLFVVTQIILVHVVTVTRRLKAMALNWLVLLGVYVIIYGQFQRVLPASLLPPAGISEIARVVNYVNGLFVYLMLFLTFCCFYYTDHSLCLAYMVEMDHRPDKKMSIDEVKKHFPFDGMLQRRFNDMVASRLVVREGDHYRLDKKGRRMIAITGNLKRFLRLEPGG